MADWTKEANLKSLSFGDANKNAMNQRNVYYDNTNNSQIIRNKKHVYSH